CCAQYLIAHFFFSSRRRHTRFSRDWSSDVCSSDLRLGIAHGGADGVGGVEDLRVDLRIIDDVDADRSTGDDVRVHDLRADRGRLLVADVGADQRVDGVEQEVLRLPADAVECQGDADGLAIRLGAGFDHGVDGRGVAGVEVDVAADGGQVAVGDARVGGAQHHVGGDDAVDGQRRALSGDAAAVRGHHALVIRGNGGGFHRLDVDVAVDLRRRAVDVGVDVAAHV